jgi:hypothetical protein
VQYQDILDGYLISKRGTNRDNTGYKQLIKAGSIPTDV